MREYSQEAEKVLSELTDGEIRQLRKDNPFRNDRNNAIRELFRRGVKQIIIAEISGLSKSQTERIIHNPPKHYTEALSLLKPAGT